MSAKKLGLIVNPVAGLGGRVGLLANQISRRGRTRARRRSRLPPATRRSGIPTIYFLATGTGSPSTFVVRSGVPPTSWLSRSLSAWLYEVSPADPLTYGAIAMLLTAVAVLSCSLPASRAARVDPSTALRPP